MAKKKPFVQGETGLRPIRNDETLDIPGGAESVDASTVTYTPTTLADWDAAADPGDVDNALDQLAERVTDIESGSEDAADITYTPAVLADWDLSADPGDVDQALDQLAERVTDLEAGGGSYTDEEAQDAVGAMLVDGATIDLTYTDATPALTAEVRSGFLNGSTLLNGYVEWSIASDDLTVAIKNTAGNNPSSGDPVYVVFRSSTATTGTLTVRSITGATSFTLTGNIGTTNNIAFRLWCVLFDDGGTMRLGLVNCARIADPTGRDTYDVRRLSSDILEDSTADGGAGTANSAHVIYTGTAVTDKPMIIVGYADWNSGLASPGTWNSAPSKVQPFHAGIPLPGSLVAIDSSELVTVATGTTTIPADDTIPQNTEGDEYLTLSVAPVSPCNVVQIRCDTHVASSATGGMSLALFQDTTADAIRSRLITIGATGSIFDLHLDSLPIKPLTGSSTTWKMRAGLNNAGTTTINGAGGARFHGSAMVTSLVYEEIMA